MPKEERDEIDEVLFEFIIKKYLLNQLNPIIFITFYSFSKFKDKIPFSILSFLLNLFFLENSCLLSILAT